MKLRSGIACVPKGVDIDFDNGVPVERLAKYEIMI